MDQLDLKLLGLLEEQPTCQISAVAKKLRISKDKASYRLKRLETAGIIEGYGAIINRDYFSRDDVIVLIKTKFCDADFREKMIKHLQNNKQTKWISDSVGSFDFYCVISVENVKDMARFEFDIKGMFSKKVESIKFLPIYEHLSWKSIFLGESSVINDSINLIRKSLDSVDYGILNELSKNSRQSLTDIALNVGVSQKVVFNRKSLYKKNGLYVGDFLKINYSKLDLTSYKILFKLNSVSEESISLFREVAKSIAEVSYADIVSGEWNLVFDVVVSDLEQLNSVLRQVEKLSGDFIESYISIQIMNNHKQTSFPACFSL